MSGWVPRRKSNVSQTLHLQTTSFPNGNAPATTTSSNRNNTNTNTNTLVETRVPFRRETTTTVAQSPVRQARPSSSSSSSSSLSLSRLYSRSKFEDIDEIDDDDDDDDESDHISNYNRNHNHTSGGLQEATSSDPTLEHHKRSLSPSLNQCPSGPSSSSSLSPPRKKHRAAHSPPVSPLFEPSPPPSPTPTPTPTSSSRSPFKILSARSGMLDEIVEQADEQLRTIHTEQLNRQRGILCALLHDDLPRSIKKEPRQDISRKTPFLDTTHEGEEEEEEEEEEIVDDSDASQHGGPEALFASSRPTQSREPTSRIDDEDDERFASHFLPAFDPSSVVSSLSSSLPQVPPKTDTCNNADTNVFGVRNDDDDEEDDDDVQEDEADQYLITTKRNQTPSTTTPFRVTRSSLLVSSSTASPFSPSALPSEGGRRGKSKRSSLFALSHADQGLRDDQVNDEQKEEDEIESQDHPLNDHRSSSHSFSVSHDTAAPSYSSLSITSSLASKSSTWVRSHIQEEHINFLHLQQQQQQQATDSPSSHRPTPISLQSSTHNQLQQAEMTRIERIVRKKVREAKRSIATFSSFFSSSSSHLVSNQNEAIEALAPFIEATVLASPVIHPSGSLSVLCVVDRVHQPAPRQLHKQQQQQQQEDGDGVEANNETKDKVEQISESSLPQSLVLPSTSPSPGALFDLVLSSNDLAPLSTCFPPFFTSFLSHGFRVAILAPSFYFPGLRNTSIGQCAPRPTLFALAVAKIGAEDENST